jgi:hypothetical protein
MATIAKLDRNGIEVVPEGQKTMGAGDSPLVDSSTGLDEGAGPSHMSLPQPVAMLIDGEHLILPESQNFTNSDTMFILNYRCKMYFIL